MRRARHTYLTNHIDDFAQRDKALLAALLYADAVLFVTKSTEILNIRDEEFLHTDVEARGIRDIFFLVNVIDNSREPMTPKDWERMYQEAWERLV
jgi:hypothetical protein